MLINNCSFFQIKLILKTLGILVLFGVILLALRLYFMGYSPPSFSPADNPAADSDSLLTRTLTFLYLPVFNFYLLVCPMTLSFDWSMGAIPLVESLFDSRVGITLVFYGFVIWLIKYCLTYYCKSTSVLPHNEKELQAHSNGHISNGLSNGHVEKLMNGNSIHSNGRVHQLTKNGLSTETVTHRRVRRDSSSSAESSR